MNAHAIDYVVSDADSCKLFAQGGYFIWDYPDYCNVKMANVSKNDSLQLNATRLVGYQLVNNGSIYNYGSINYTKQYNFGSIDNESDHEIVMFDANELLDNHGMLTNKGRIQFCKDTSINNKTGAILTNTVDGEIQCCYNVYTDCGTITNSAGALFINQGSIDADVTIKNNCGGIIQDTGSTVTYIQDTTNCDTAVNNLSAAVKAETSGGLESSLSAILDNVNKLLAAGKIKPAINMLNAFIAEVEAQTDKKQLTSSESEYLVALAQAIIDSLTA